MRDLLLTQRSADAPPTKQGRGPVSKHVVREDCPVLVTESTFARSKLGGSCRDGPQSEIELPTGRVYQKDFPPLSSGELSLQGILLGLSR
jgi:hypothetical protein